MSNNITGVPASKCTGCSACLNICPVDAISMQPDSEGFIMPVVDESKCVNCGKCLKQCPAMNVSYKNNENPKLYAAMADDGVRAVSSSGGMFSLAANVIFEQGGYVCGAAFDDNAVLAHRLIDSEDKMPKLRGSKYLQSSINTVYREIKKILTDNKPVLFAGTPCQVAGLKAYLQKDYDKLYTLDILCHGVPSQQVFSKYLEEIAKKNTTDKATAPKAVDIQFRDKRFGWSAESIHIEFDNGKVYENNLKNKDPYEFVFLRNVALRKSCENCPFSVFPRQGDLSIGDFWGISKFDKTMTDKKGTSLVYVNSKQGEELFAEMQKKCIKIKEMHINPDEIHNRIRAVFPANKNRGRFLKMVQNNNFEESVSNIRNKHFDVGLVSNFYAGNFGGALTQYALYHVLEDFGYSTLMIERPKTAKNADKTVHNLEKIFIEKPYPDYAIAPQYQDKTAMRALNNQCDTFVVGSDQLFQYSLFRVLGEFVTLDWVSDDKKKIAYAASYGHDTIWGNQKVHSEMAYFMQKFDAFSVREESGVRISKEHYGVDAEWVLDPVFLCDPKHYHALAEKATREIPQHFLAGYVLDPTEEKQHIFKAAMEKLSLPDCEIFSEYNCSAEYTAPLGDLNVPNLKTEERLKNIINCDFFVTDSFHGTCFAIIMRKPFVSILNKNRGASRFKSLLSMLHLEHRLIESEEDLSRPDLFTPIDFDAVYEILDKEMDRCRNWLFDALKAPKLKSYSDYDMMVKLIDQQNQRIDTLEKLIVNLTGNLSKNLSDKTDILDYLDLLNTQKKDNIIVVSVKDTPGLNLDSFIAQKLMSLGLKNSLEGKHSHSYIAVIDDGSVVYENLGENLEPSVFQAKVSGHNLMVTSRVYKNGNESIINIDNKDYSVNKRGLNIVVFNKTTNTVIDSVSFDTHVKDCTCQRNK